MNRVNSSAIGRYFSNGLLAYPTSFFTSSGSGKQYQQKAKGEQGVDRFHICTVKLLKIREMLKYCQRKSFLSILPLPTT
jgi:hypothetical protein